MRAVFRAWVGAESLCPKSNRTPVATPPAVDRLRVRVLPRREERHGNPTARQGRRFALPLHPSQRGTRPGSCDLFPTVRRLETRPGFRALHHEEGARPRPLPSLPWGLAPWNPRQDFRVPTPTRKERGPAPCHPSHGALPLGTRVRTFASQHPRGRSAAPPLAIPPMGPCPLEPAPAFALRLRQGRSGFRARNHEQGRPLHFMGSVHDGAGRKARAGCAACGRDG